MKKFLLWLAHSPTAEAVKIGVGAAAAWLLNNVTSFQRYFYNHHISSQTRNY
jgi:hypothetical protein